MEARKERHHDIHATPPEAVCDVFRRYQRMEDVAVDQDLIIVDFTRGLSPAQKDVIVSVGVVPAELIAAAQEVFIDGGLASEAQSTPAPSAQPCTIYEHKSFPGLRMLPSLLPKESQIMLVDCLLHRDLSNPQHKNNLQDDYDIPFPPPSTSFFTYAHSSRDKIFVPLESASSHKPLNTVQFLAKKLRWVTLGTQYDWRTREYSSTSPTPFPPDIAKLVTGLFQDAFVPESGVVLIYGTKDYMPVHRDVSEECERGLASFSLGCDGLFVVAREKETDISHPTPNRNTEETEQETVVIRVRSGDVVQMDGDTRWAWHAMPKVIGGTCPEWLEDWPVVSNGPKEYEKWKGFMKGKRLNISCRQVWG